MPFPGKSFSGLFIQVRGRTNIRNMYGFIRPFAVRHDQPPRAFIVGEGAKCQVKIAGAEVLLHDLLGRGLVQQPLLAVAVTCGNELAEERMRLQRP